MGLRSKITIRKFIDWFHKLQRKVQPSNLKVYKTIKQNYLWNSKEINGDYGTIL